MGNTEETSLVVQRLESIFKSIRDLDARVRALEKQYDGQLAIGSAGCSGQAGANSDAAAVVEELSRVCASIGLQSAKFKITPPDYYDWELLSRAQFLKAATEDHLCKSIVLENTRWCESDNELGENHKYYCVIVQYTAKFHPEKMMKLIRGWSDNKISKKHLHFRLAPPEVSLELTGYDHGGVTPVGMKTAMPVLISDRVLALQPPVIWLGGGHVLVKLQLAVAEIVGVLKARAADVVY